MFDNATIVTINELFPRNAIAALIEEMFKEPGVLDAFFPDIYEPGFEVEYTILSGGREMAPVVNINSASVAIQPGDEFKIRTEPLVVKGNIPMTPKDLLSIADPSDPNKNGADRLKVKYANEIMGAIRRRKWWAISQLLTKGRIYYVGGVQNPVKIYIDFDLLATHKRSVDNTLIAEAWGTADADPFSDIIDAAGLVDDDGGAPATHVIMNRNTMLLATRSQKFRDQLITTSANTTDFDLISRFKTMLAGADIEPVLVNESYAAGGSVHRYIPDGYVAVLSLTGNDGGNSQELFGETVNVSSLDAGMQGSEFRTGIWSNTLTTEDPVSVKMVGGNTFLPVIRYPDRLVLMKVTAGDPDWGIPTY